MSHKQIQLVNEKKIFIDKIFVVNANRYFTGIT